MLAMEFKVEMQEDFVENNQKDTEMQPFTFINLKNFKNELEDNLEMGLTAKVKQEFNEGDQGYIESQLFTSPDFKDFINKTDEDNSGLSQNRMEIMKTELACTTEQQINADTEETTGSVD
ncbi:unnamed protein product [Diabrotica balteata]|uniref:Uncharacterized protein n=1 Tax=Diabrotica balteata TaxID=107213 RepID=A0A9P0GSC0_DIABA|nr:unnamed protein product [Diabrotica balteata]